MEAVAQEILAWRGWHLDLDEAGEWWLHSVTMRTRWEGPVFVADKVPNRDSQHGVYALQSRALVYHQSYQGNCVGEVALSGVVVEGSNGYRAERATIRRLILLGYPTPDVRPIEVMAALEDKYQCEVAWEEPSTPRDENVFNRQLWQQQQAYLSAYQNQLSNSSQFYGISGMAGMLGYGFGRP